jgi:hypothetical protein
MNDYHKVGGYGGSRMYNPDKWLHWRLLVETEYTYFIDKPLFSYRWHNHNQASLQKKSGLFKFYIDEYRNSFEFEETSLIKVGLSSDKIRNSFVYNVIFKNVFSNLKKGHIVEGWRVFCFGWVSYPYIMVKSVYTWLFFVLLILGKFSTLLLRPVKNNYT